MPNKFDRYKSWFWVILDVALIVLVLLGLVAGKALLRYSKSVYPSRTINVSAEGKSVVSPDIATFSFSVVAEGPDPEKLQNDNTEKIAKAVDFLKAEGVAAADIKTAGYNLSPKYQYDEKLRKSFIDGYTLNQNVRVKVRDLSKVGKLIGQLPSFGINEVSGLSFDIDDPDRFLNEARKEAFEKARAKAEEMAGYNGVRIRKVVNFSESGGGYPIYFAKEAAGRGGDLALPASTPPTIEPGSQEVTVNVSVTYEIW